ncbi:MAG: glycosyltransferase family 9 protein [bacterium]
MGKGETGRMVLGAPQMEIKKEAAKKILVVCLDNLGDMVMSTCLIEPIKRSSPKTQLFYWVKKNFVEMLENDPLIDGIIGGNPFWTGALNWSSGSLMDYFKTLAAIKKKKFDKAIIVNSCWRKALSLLSVPERVGVDQKKSKLFLSSCISDKKISEGERGYAFKLLLKAIGCGVEDISARLVVPNSENSFIKEFAEKHDLFGRNIFIFHVFSADRKRDWPIDNYKFLAAEILKEYPASKIIVVYGKGEKERLFKVFGNNENVVLTSLTLAQDVVVFSKSSVFIGPDSGPMHLASGVGLPIISFFSAAQNPSWKTGPMGISNKTLIDIDDLNKLTAEEIFNKVALIQKHWKDRIWK